MQRIEFTDPELDVLREVLRHEMSEIDLEIFRTDTHDFKEMLKRRRDVLDHVLTKLAAAPQPA